MAPLIADAGSLDPRGPVAEDILDLTWVLTGLGVAVFVVFAAMLGLGLARRRSSSRDPGSSALSWIIGGGVAMPVVVLIIVFGFTAKAMRATPETAPPGALRVEVVGHQWWYEVRYPDHGFSTANEMHIPVGRPVEVGLVSADVIHSFWVPALAGKMDLLPDNPNTLVLEADEAGEYHGSCAEFCGLQHAKMRFVVVADAPDRFRAWLEAQQSAAAEPADPVARRGRQVFGAAGCGTCHTIEGTPADGTRGPDLTHLASRQSLASGTLPNTERHLAEWIADPQGVKRGTQMDAPGLSEPDLEALLAYLESLE